MPIGTTSRHPVLIAALVAGVLLAMAPLGAALNVHHQLAAADHDGHQHSDFDLCQWVQHHETSSPALHVPDLGQPWRHRTSEAQISVVVLASADLSSQGSPRGPPLS